MSGLEIRNIRKVFLTPAEDLVVLEDVSFDLKAGENLAILGPSGTGKSTLMHIIGTLDTATSGSVHLNGVDPFSLSEKELAQFRNRHIGFVFQDHYLLPHLTLGQNILVPALAAGKLSPEIELRAIELLDRVGLKERTSHLPSELSGGERGRAAVARALLLRPALILADEPTGNLDADNAQRITQLLIELQKQENAMLIVVTHSQDLAKQMQRNMLMERGRLL